MTVSGSFTVIVDNKAQEVGAGTTLADLVAQLGHQPADVATAVNGQFISRSTRSERALEPGDAVTLFQPIVGG